MKHILLALTTTLFAQVQFTPKALNLGSFTQGESRHFSVEYQSTDSIQFIDVIAQGNGPKNLKFKKQLSPGETGTLSFDFTTNYMQGGIYEHISLIDSKENIHSIPIEGIVHPAIQFFPSQVDFGFLEVGKKVTRTIYAYTPKAEKFSLEFLKQEGFQATVHPTTLTIESPEHIKEGGTIPGFKIDLTYTPKQTKKALHKLIPFKSPQFPKANPEIQALGFPKNY